MAKIKTPEEEELEQKLQDLGVLESDLAQKELELATLTAELQAVESRYIRVVGRRFAELDLLNAQIAEIVAMQNPEEVQAQSAAKAARKKADEAASEAGVSPKPSKGESFIPTKELQELYRDLAKKVHPDLAVDEEDRKRRNKIMAEVNKAYSEGDTDRLQAILEDWKTSPEAIEGEDVGSRLVRTIRMISRIKRRIGQIEQERQALMKSELQELKAKFDEAKQEGRDLFEEMAERLDDEIESARAKLQELEAISP